MIVRLGIIFLAVTSLAGCMAVNSESSVARFASGFRPSEHSPRFIALLSANAPALQVGFIERKAGGTLLLESDQGGLQTWISPEGAALITEKGMLRGTRGFGAGFLAAEISQPLTMVTTEREGWVQRFHTYLSGEDESVTRTYRCMVTRRGKRDVTLGDRSAKTVLMQEDCSGLQDSFFNLYWVEKSRIVQSRQWTGSHLGAVSTRMQEK